MRVCLASEIGKQVEEAGMELFTTLFVAKDGELFAGTVEAENMKGAALRAADTFGPGGTGYYRLLGVAKRNGSTRNGHGDPLFGVSYEMPPPVALTATLSGGTLSIGDLD